MGNLQVKCGVRQVYVDKTGRIWAISESEGESRVESCELGVDSGVYEVPSGGIVKCQSKGGFEFVACCARKPNLGDCGIDKREYWGPKERDSALEGIGGRYTLKAEGKDSRVVRIKRKFDGVSGGSETRAVVASQNEAAGQFGYTLNDVSILSNCTYIYFMSYGTMRRPYMHMKD